MASYIYTPESSNEKGSSQETHTVDGEVQVESNVPPLKAFVDLIPHSEARVQSLYIGFLSILVFSPFYRQIYISESNIYHE
jgi:hypothetical protein